MPCVFRSNYVSTKCMELGCSEEAHHVFERGTGGQHDIAHYCDAHCDSCKPATPKVWPQEKPETLVAEQKGLFE